MKAAQSLIVIGLDLIEAKAQLQHGEWLDFLDRAGFNARTASNYMRVAGAVEETPKLAALPYSKALALIEAPDDARERIMADGVEDKSAAEIRRLAKELAETKEKLATTDQCFRNQTQAVKAEAREKAKAQERVRELEAELRGRKPVKETVEVAPPDYADLKSAVETLRAQLADAEAAVEEAEARAAGSFAAPADEPEPDRITVVGYIEKCNDFMSGVQFYPYHRDDLAALGPDALRQMEIFTQGVQNWAVRMLSALAAAGGAVECEGAVSGE